MESALAWEYKKLIDELTQGMEKAMELRLHLYSTSPSEAQDLLLQKILSTFENALFILKRGGTIGQARTGAPTPAAPESSVSVDGSPKSEDMNKNLRVRRDHGDTSKRRKLQSTWTEQVRVNSDNGLEGPTDDGYSWRKYGQKDILGAKHPRSYYRCTYRLVRNCWATKQVQRSDDDPTVFEITYKGAHTCNPSSNAVSQPASPEKQELEDNNSLLNLKAKNLRVNTEDLDIKNIPANFSFPSACIDRENHYSPISALADENHIGTYSPLFYSPATSESNYFSASTGQMTSYVGAPMQRLETDIAEIISAHASTTNSPIGGMEFLIDPVDLDPNFPFSTFGFFT
ncbi:hypothetical protein DH2020_028958 [Rehmannia glutinosa]|uniref:WRKY domain-containing protein n=1 Tax=Rehmannia glutinosa TaxID=99300 RepID=A0ABR0VU78_REHGL